MRTGMRLSFFGGFVGLISLAHSQILLAGSLPDFTELVEQYGDAVVNISTTQKAEPNAGLPPGMQMPDIPEDSPLNDLFRHFFGEGMPPGQGRGQEEPDTRSLGSGFIISDDGYIVTNYHVVKGADEVLVRLEDRREMRAVVVGSDERADIAIVKIEGDNLHTVKIGNPDELKVGEWVLAIGSPFGFERSVTAGIVSAKGRSLPTENYVPFIQTDVAINPGNSGGPLFNMEGEVVGVNAQIYSRSGGSMGLSFSIPIDVAMDVVEQIKKQGHVSRGWLGVLIQDVTYELAESFGMDKPVGALVARILPESPAKGSGLQVGDVIVEYNGKHIDQSAELPPLVGRSAAGSSNQVKVIRNGKPINLSIKVGELPEEKETKLASSKDTSPGAKENRLGISVKDLTAEQQAELEIEGKGVLVVEVEKGPGLHSGLLVGDIILMVNNQNVADAKSFAAILDGVPSGDSVPMLVQRRAGPTFLALKMP